MSGLKCKKCGSSQYVKNGHVREIQRYKCKVCGCQFTDTKPRGVDPALRKMGVLLYSHFGVSLSGVSRLFKVSVQAVLKWVKAAADTLKDPDPRPSEPIQVDEMWHFVNGKKTKFGSGGPFVGYQADLLDGTSVIVLIKP